MYGFPIKRLSQLRARLDEGRTGNVQPHHFHHHLVRIGSAIECAGAGRVIAAHFAGEQFIAANLALCIELACLLLILIRYAAWHWTGRHKDRGQMAKAQSADH